MPRRTSPIPLTRRFVAVSTVSPSWCRSSTSISYEGVLARTSWSRNFRCQRKSPRLSFFVLRTIDMSIRMPWASPPKDQRRIIRNALRCCPHTFSWSLMAESSLASRISRRVFTRTPNSSKSTWPSSVALSLIMAANGFPAIVSSRQYC